MKRVDDTHNKIGKHMSIIIKIEIIATENGVTE
jgi:hypothetical protein